MARPKIYDDDVRQRLLEAASAIVSADGVGGLSLRDLATRAGTTTAAVYTLFGGRDGLIEAVVDEGLARFTARMSAVEADSDPGAHLLALGIAYRDSALADPHFYRVMFGGFVPPRERPPAEQPTFVLLREAAERLLATESGPTERAEELAWRLWAKAHGLVSLELAGYVSGDDAERRQRYIDALADEPLT